MNCIALTSDKPNSATGNYLAKMGELFSDLPTVLITWERHRYGLRERLGKAGRRPKQAIFIEDLNDPVMTAQLLGRTLRRRSLRLVNWINVPDTLTDTFLYCSEQLEISFPFLGPYTRCRVKPLARQILASAGHSSIAHEALPRGGIAPRALSGPKICKPITGSGSREVQIVATTAQLVDYSLKFPATGVSRYSIAGYRPGEQFLMEDRLNGPEALEIEVDGYVHLGHVSVCALGYKHHEYGEYGFREVAGVTYFPFSLEHRRARDTKIIEWVREVMTDLEFTGGVFHLEAMDLGDCIELIEINPRPGGGGVQVICERLSGVVLATECMRLWLGLSPEREPRRGDVYCISYCVVYPDHPGRLTKIAAKQQGEVALASGRMAFTWEPLWKAGGEPFKGDREEYLGEAHFTNQAFTPESLGATAESVRDALKGRGFWEIDPPT